MASCESRGSTLKSTKISESLDFSVSQHLLTVKAQRAVRTNILLTYWARAGGVICDESGHNTKQRWWKIVAHSLDDE